jgi:hypothetical protein
MNNESGGTFTVASTGFTTVQTSGAMIFPELRDIDAVWHGMTNSNVTIIAFESSVDTTNGLDGTWTGHGAYTARAATDKISMRQDITSYTGITAVKAIRWRATNVGGGGGNAHRISPHVFGKPSVGAAPDRLRLWHPTLDQQVPPAHFDWGNIAISTNQTKTFRVKNPSTTLTAQAVTISANALTDSTPTNVSQHTFSLNGIDFASTLNIGNLAPDAVSSVISVKRTLPSNAPLGLWWARILAVGTYV